ncbi:unnamed protein product [Sphagnum jensenii]|uniref:Uncharacterized protein n=1 Tax=Sphagnum jensenii TaxID=128206 RepID=A0ABP1AKM4_9BRYO
MMTSTMTPTVTSAMTQDSPPKIGRKPDEVRRKKNLRMMLQSTPNFVAMAALSGLRERQETMRRTSRWSLERVGTESHNDAATRYSKVLLRR